MTGAEPIETRRPTFAELSTMKLLSVTVSGDDDIAVRAFYVPTTGIVMVKAVVVATGESVVRALVGWHVNPHEAAAHRERKP